MSDLITDAMVEASAATLYGEGWDGVEYATRFDYRTVAAEMLAAAAPAIAAKAWDEGYAMSERELDHAYGGHPISPDDPSDLCHECGTGNPYRADHIQRGES